MAEQIQYATQAPRMFAYIQEPEWTDAKCQSVNWKTIGKVKDRLYIESNKDIKNALRMATRSRNKQKEARQNCNLPMLWNGR